MTQVGEEEIKALVLRWTMRTPNRAEHMLAADFAYLSEVERHDRADFIQGMMNQTPWNDVSLLCVFTAPRRAAAFFEGIDPTTNLRYRIAWLLEHDGAMVHRLMALHTILMNADLAT